MDKVLDMMINLAGGRCANPKPARDIDSVIILVKVHNRPVNGVPHYSNRVPDYYDKHGEEYYLADSDGDFICVKCNKTIHEGHECYLRGWYEEIVHCSECVITIDIMDAVDAYEEGMDSETNEGD